MGNKLSFLSEDIVTYLNQSSPTNLADWLEQNPVMRNFVTSPYISIRPTAIPRAQRITAYENQLGRFFHMSYRDGSHRYIFNIAHWNQTVEDIEALIQKVDEAGGSCHVERSFLILMIPAGYELEVCAHASLPEIRLLPLAE